MIEVNTTHNGRTAEFKYETNRDRAQRIPNILRAKYGREYQVNTLELDEYNHIVALTCRKWHKVPKYMLQGIPYLIEGFLEGWDSGFLEGHMARTPEKLWDKPPKKEFDIFISPPKSLD